MHQRRPNQCREYGGSSICQHRRQRSKCTECRGSRINFVRTGASAVSAKTVEVAESVSTENGVSHARSAEAAAYAFMVDRADSVRNAEAVESVSSNDNEADARDVFPRRLDT